MSCRHCNAPLAQSFADLGWAPPSNRFLAEADLGSPEPRYPLKTFVCGQCWLVQTEDHPAAAELFDHNYPYFSSTSASWLAHAHTYADGITRRLALSERSFVIEVGSNDGYLLKNFVAASIPCLGIEPTASTAAAAEAQGVPVMRDFFNATCVSRIIARHGQADLIVGNNVFAHVPDPNGFAAALRMALKPGGVVTLEFPHLLELIRHLQFDTIYHEHFSYLSLHSAARILAGEGLEIFDVEHLGTHGGSLRVYGRHAGSPGAVAPSVAGVLAAEAAAGLRTMAPYAEFQSRMETLAGQIRAFLEQERRRATRIAGYGAAAKAATLLNYLGAGTELIPYICDRAPSKQGKFLPGCRIPVRPPQQLAEDRPGLVAIFPWNIAGEIRSELSQMCASGCRFATFIPETRVVPN